ncbi:MAG: sugar nucleotide-binding protein [Erysipelotrichaceae bacterium]|nr:sugar nucleotide-binding protein [Erysipelotrichaceae bacterium]
MKIAVTGATGYIASLVMSMNPQIEWVPVGRKDLDLSNPEAVYDYFTKLDFDAVFHCAAMAQTADCENYPELTHRINVESAIEIGKVCKEKNARFVFISTEQVFNGVSEHGPFAEDHPVCSVTKYGNHKVECEQWINENLDNFLILRFSWMLGMGMPGVRVSPNIIKNVMNAMLYQKPTKFTVNEMRGMTYAKHLGAQFGKMMELPSGTYHVTNVNRNNTYESAKIVAGKLGFTPEQTDAYILPDTDRYADRFRDYTMDNSKLASYGITFGTFEEDVDECLRDFGWMK